MSAKFIVGYDGSAASERALDFAIGRVKLQGGAVVLVHVLEWSPYSFLTPSELEERHKRRTGFQQHATGAGEGPRAGRRGRKQDPLRAYRRDDLQHRRGTGGGADRDRAQWSHDLGQPDLRVGRGAPCPSGAGALHHRAMSSDRRNR